MKNKKPLRFNRQEIPSNVCCIRCEYWQQSGYCKKTEEGWICNECGQKNETDKKI